MNYINKYGYWKDLIYISFNLYLFQDYYELELFANKLKEDIKLLRYYKKRTDIKLQ